MTRATTTVCVLLKEIVYPVIHLSPFTGVMQFLKKDLVIYLVKSLGIIEIYNICLYIVLVVVQDFVIVLK